MTVVFCKLQIQHPDSIRVRSIIDKVYKAFSCLIWNVLGNVALHIVYHGLVRGRLAQAIMSVRSDNDILPLPISCADCRYCWKQVRINRVSLAHRNSVSLRDKISRV